jgi:hypothetical protein
MAVFWAVAPCSLVEMGRHFRGAASVIRRWKTEDVTERETEKERLNLRGKSRKHRNKELYNCYCPSDVDGSVKQVDWDGRGMLYAWRRREMYTKFWLESLKGRDNSEDPDVLWRIILKFISVIMGCEFVEKIRFFRAWWRPLVNSVKNLQIP